MISEQKIGALKQAEDNESKQGDDDEAHGRRWLGLEVKRTVSASAGKQAVKLGARLSLGLLVAAVVCVTLSAGVWQWRKGQWREAIEQLPVAAPRTVATSKPLATAELGAQLVVAARLQPDRQLLLDNQRLGTAPAALVYALAERSTGETFWVIRGLGVLDRNRPEVPALEDRQQLLAGVWAPLPAPGIALADDPPPRWGALYVRLSPQQLQQLAPTAPAMALWLSGASPGALTRVMAAPALAGGIPAARHYGYAVQWFGLSVALPIAYLFWIRR